MAKMMLGFKVPNVVCNEKIEEMKRNLMEQLLLLM
jgi:hypothetical protein